MNTAKKIETFKSDLTGNEFPISEKIPASSISKSIMDLILKENPEFARQHSLAESELNMYRQKYIEAFLMKQMKGELSSLEKTVMGSLNTNTPLQRKFEDDLPQNTTFGQRIADKVAGFGGSWVFIVIFTVFLVAWMVLNVYWYNNKGFDPYPFILLNLILSTLAALQAPVIMMSQNRQEEKDRERAKKDYMTNLKSEIEVRMLHEKVDHLILSLQQEALEIHKVEFNLLNEILKKLGQEAGREPNNKKTKK
ncbi:MAG TPA: DUF1003 domain-containing protein [Paludibacter sp.]|nr:DUF1003 domain-containing protein [Paludibacter sp.]